MTTIYLHSSYAGPAQPVQDAAAQGRVTIVCQGELTPEHLQGASGLITGNQLDQNAFLDLKADLEAFMDRGGRWFFNGHIVRPLLDGLGIYAPMQQPKLSDFSHTRLAPHPIFDGLELAHLETNKGVAGFYGRGANPLPAGGIAVTGLRNGTVPVDWLWPRPGGGRFFSHAGNDLGQMGLEHGLSPLLHSRIIDWANGGPCL